MRATPLSLTCQKLTELGFVGWTNRFVRSTAAVPAARQRAHSTLFWFVSRTTMFFAGSGPRGKGTAAKPGAKPVKTRFS